MDNFIINVVIDEVEYTVNAKIDNNVVTLYYNGSNISFYKNEVEAIEIDSQDTMKIVLKNKILIFKGSNIINFVNYFSNFKIYNESNIRVNPTISSFIKTPIGLSMLYTLIYIIIYRGIIGASVSDKLGTSDVNAFFVGILGVEEYYPTDMLEIISYVLLLLELICAIVLYVNKRKKTVALLQNYSNSIAMKDVTNVNRMDNNESSLQTLENLKKLLDSGVITQEDFDRKKADILAKM